MEFYQTASALKISAAEKQQVTAARDRLALACQLTQPYAAPGASGERSPIQIKIGEVAEKFKASPTPELAEELAQLFLLHENSKSISAGFGGLTTTLREELSASMIPLAKELTRRTVLDLDAQLETVIKGLEKLGGGMESTIAEFRIKHARALEVAGYDFSQLAQNHRCAFAWVSSTFTV
jgi:hypothetical protein